MTSQKTFHVVSLPHTQTTQEFASCAYTTKVRRFCNMMTSMGHKVFLYSGEQNEAQVYEHVPVVSEADRISWFGEPNKDLFYNITWGQFDTHWVNMNSRAIAEIGKRKQPGDIVAIIGGVCQQMITWAFPDLPSVEYGIGYAGTYSDFKIYESYAWMHTSQGDGDGNYYSAVIPNYYDVTEFPFLPGEQDDYYLFIGRLTWRKGVSLAVESTQRIGATLILAGQGLLSQENGKLVSEEVIEDVGNVIYEGDHLLHVGPVGPEERGQLMARAKAVYVPTRYIGPFEGVNVEAQLCGRPVITSDFGCFAETVEHGKTGYRCHMAEEFDWAAQHADELDTYYIRQRAAELYSVERVALMYDAYFDMIGRVWDGGWYAPNPERTDLSWMPR